MKKITKIWAIIAAVATGGIAIGAFSLLGPAAESGLAGTN
jgi:hypothetical protein